MPNSFFHNGKSIDVAPKIEKADNTYQVKKKINVDINKLLNRIKLNKKKEAKEKIILLSFVVVSLSSVGLFLSFAS